MEDQIKKTTQENLEVADSPERREVVRKLGRYAVYAAPFTVLAFTKKASAASGGFGGHNPGRPPLH